MTARSCSSWLCVAVFAATLGLVRSARAATLQEQVDYGGTGAVMNLYVPDAIEASPAIVVSLHCCGGSAQNAAVEMVEIVR